MTALFANKPNLLRSSFSVQVGGPQGLRRPRFSFFRFTFQTTRSLSAPLPYPRVGETRSSDAATRTWPSRAWPDARSPCEQCGASQTRHSASGGAPKRVYIVFGCRYCQPAECEKKTVVRGENGNSCRRSRARAAAWQCTLAGRDASPNRGLRAMLRRTPATFLRRSLHSRVWDVANRGKRQLHLSFPPWRIGIRVAGSR